MMTTRTPGPVSLLVLVLALALLPACDPCQPGVVLANDASALADQRGASGLLPDTNDQAYCPETPVDGCMLSELDDGQSFVLAHQLPRNPARGGSSKLVQVNLDEPLLVTIETPCGTLTREFQHDEFGSVEATLLVPPGGGCGMSVNTSIANAHSSCSYSGTNCDGLSERCENFEGDAAGESTETSTSTSTDSAGDTGTSTGG